jgi:hypothetical protein
MNRKSRVLRRHRFLLSEPVLKDDRIHNVSALDTPQCFDLQLAGAVEQVDAELAHHESAAAGTGGAIANGWSAGPARTLGRLGSHCHFSIHVHFLVCSMIV